MSSAGSRASSRGSSPKASAPSSKRASGSGVSVTAEAKYPDPDASSAVRAATVSRPTSRPASAKQPLGRPTSGAPVKAVYRPAAPTPAQESGAASGASSARVQPVAAVSAAAKAPAPASTRPRRLPNLSPDDSDYDSDEVLSEEETEEEKPLVHAPAKPLPFALTKPDPRSIADPDQRAPEADGEVRAHEQPLALRMQHIVGAPELLPVTSVSLEHQSTALESAGAAVATAFIKKLAASGSNRSSFNVMSFSSGPEPSQANDLLYADAHAPYTFSKHAKPMSIWILGKPLAGKSSLGKRLQRELGNNGSTVLLNGGAPQTGGRAAAPVRPARKEYSSNIALLTPEFLLSHARESSATLGAPKFPEIDSLLAGLADGKAISPDVLFKLFVFALHSERVAYHGYILPDLSFLAPAAGAPGATVADLANLGTTYPALVERGVWPPQHVVELEISDEEVMRRLALRKSAYIARRLGDVLGFREQRVPTAAETLAAQLLALEDVTGGDGTAGDSAPPSSAPAASGSLSRPTSAMSRSAGGNDDARLGGTDSATEYPLAQALHRPNDVDDWDETEYESLAENHLPPSVELAVNYKHLRLDSEASVAEELLQYESLRTQLRQLVGTWSQFHPSGSPLSLSSVQRLQAFNAAHPLRDLVRLTLAALGQNKWTSGLALAQHLPFVAKEELRPIEEDEVRELLLLPNLNNSNKDAPGGIVVPLPQTNDPSGLDLETERAFDLVQHRFGVWQTYCPVSLLEEGRLVEGSESCAVSFQGHVYLLASKMHMRKFKENPLKFVSTPPALPGNFVLSIVGGPSVGKSSLANLLGSRFGWTVHSLDGSEETLTRVSAKVNAGGQHVLDGGFTSVAQLESAQAQGLRIDKVAYVYVDDVEVLPGRLRLARAIAQANRPPQTEEQKALAEAEAAALALSVAEKTQSPAGKKGATKKGGKDSKDSKKKAAASKAARDDDDADEEQTTPDEEDLMDRVEEFQNDLWPNALLPFLEEHAYACTEINNSTIVPPPVPQSGNASTSTSAAPTTAPTPTPFATSSSGSAAGGVASPISDPSAMPAAGTVSGPATLPPTVLSALDATFESLRRCVDPFFNFRFVSAARRITAEMVEKSWSQDDRIPRGPMPSVSRGTGAGTGNVSSAVSQAGGAGQENPRGLKFNETTFCPVCLLGEQRLLVPGVVSEGVSLGAQSYSCCSPQCALSFVSDPARFNLNSPARLEELAPEMPALRIMVTGARSSGKSAAARVLQSHFQLAYAFSLGELFFPALKNLAASTLALVLATEAEEAARKAAEKEARRAARKARREEELAARIAAGGSAEEDDPDDALNNDEDFDSGSESGGDIGDNDTQSQYGTSSNAGDAADRKDKDLLRLYVSTPLAKITDHTAILNELLEEEWFSAQQLEQLLRDIFASHAWINLSPSAPRNHTNAAGWVCEVDLHNPHLLARLEAVIRDRDPATHFAKPHVVLPLTCTTRTAVARMVATEQARRAASKKDGLDEASVDGGGDAAQSAMLRNLSEKHRLRQEAAEKAAREQREKEEAAAAAKAAKPKRFGAKDKKGSAGASKDDKKEEKSSTKKKSAKAEAAAAEAEAAAAGDKAKEEAAAAEAAAAAAAEAGRKTPDASSSSTAAGADGSASAAAGGAVGGEKSEAELAAQAAAARALEELTGVMTDLLKASVESNDFFVSTLRREVGGFVVLSAVSSTSAVRLGASKYLAKLVAVFQNFLQAQAALFQPTVEISMSDSNKLLRNGMRTFRSYGSFCPCCLLPAEGSGAEPTAYDCKTSLTNAGGLDYFPIMWGHNIVLTCSREHAKEFCRDARRYLLAEPPAPIVAHRIVVLESPTASVGESVSTSAALARKVAIELNLVHLNLESVLTQAAAPSNPLALGQRVREALADGELLSDALLVQCVAHAVQSHYARSRGWVLEDFPQTRAQARLLKAAGVVPHEVLTVHDSAAEANKAASIDVGSAKQSARAQLISRLVSAQEESVTSITEEPVVVEPTEEGEEPPPPVPFKRRRGVSTLVPPSLASVSWEDAIVAPPRSSWNSEEGVLAEVATALAERELVEKFYESNYHNVNTLYTGAAPGAAGASTPDSFLRSGWQQSERALQLLSAHKRLRQDYFLATHSATFDASRPGRIAHLCLTRPQLLQHASSFGDYCNICYVRDGLLNTAPEVTANRFTTEYRQQMYRACSAEHQAIFESDPDAYASKDGSAHSQLPKDLPFVVAPTEAARIGPEHCELNGFCPVTIRQSALQGSAAAVVPGSPDCTVSYRRRVYRMRGPRELSLFLSLPSVYSAVRLPQKLPPVLASSSLSPRTRGDGVGSGARGALALSKRDSKDLLCLGKTLAFMEVEFSALLMRGLATFDTLAAVVAGPSSADAKPLPRSERLRLKFPALPLNSSALLYLALYLKTHNPRNEPHVQEKYQKHMQRFLQHCALIPTLAKHYKGASAAADGSAKAEEESKQQPADAAAADQTTDAPAEDPAFADAALQYDTLRAEMRAYAGALGSKRNLAQMFERYVR